MCPIYHTNVMMSVAERMAVVCFEAIKCPKERNMLENVLKDTQKAIVEISEEQMGKFAGNMLQIKNAKGEPITVMSSAAYSSLHSNQIELLKLYGRILHTPLTVIETLGGGSARCMLAEVFH